MMTIPARCLLSFLLLSAPVLAERPPLIVDGDGDGLSDEIDECPYTPPGIQINRQGCPLLADDGDADGVADAQDDCPYTPPSARVDFHGCAGDADFDGVADGLDRCLTTGWGMLVDSRGCDARAVVTADASPLEPGVMIAPPAPMAVWSQTPVTPLEAAAVASPVRVSPTPSPSVQPLMPLAELPSARLVSVVAPLPDSRLPLAVGKAPPSAMGVVQEEALAVALRTEEAARSLSLGRSAASVALPDQLSETILFTARGIEPSRRATQDLLALAPALRVLAVRSSRSRIEIAAYADRREGPGASALVVARAERVRTWLMAQGVPGERIRSSVRVLDEGELARNRRVSISTVD